MSGSVNLLLLFNVLTHGCIFLDMLRDFNILLLLEIRIELLVLLVILHLFLTREVQLLLHLLVDGRHEPRRDEDRVKDVQGSPFPSGP